MPNYLFLKKKKNNWYCLNIAYFWGTKKNKCNNKKI